MSVTNHIASTRPSTRTLGLVGLAYAGLSVLLTWPLITHLSTHLPGPSNDSLPHYWNEWWVQQAISSGQNPLSTPYLFYPEGVSLVTHNMAWFNILLWQPLEPILGGIAAHNATILITLTLVGVAAFWLTYKLTDDVGAGFLAGFIYLAWPFRFSQLDHPNLIATQWIPLFFLFLIHTLRPSKMRHAVIAGLLFALVGYTRWQLLIGVSIMAAVYITLTAPAWLSVRRREVLTQLLAAAVTASLLLLPPGLLLLSQVNDEIDVNLLRDDEETMQTDAFAFFTPPRGHQVLGEKTGGLYDHYYADRTPGRRFPAYIGLVAFILAVAGVRLRGRKSLPWIGMTLVLMLLALGPILRLNGQLYEGIPTLYRLLSPIRVGLIRVPDRFNMFVALPISVLAGYGASRLGVLLRRRGRWLPAAMLSLVAILVYFDYGATPISLRSISRHASSFFAQLRDETGDFAIVNVPFNPLLAKVYMFQQTMHHRPIVQGKIARIPDEQYAFIEAHPILRRLRGGSEFPPFGRKLSLQLASLSDAGIRYIILHKSFMASELLDYWLRHLQFEPVHDDETIVVFSTAPKAGRDFKLLAELVPGLGPVVSYASSPCVNPDSTFEVDVGWGSTLPMTIDFDVELTVVRGESGHTYLKQEVPLTESWPTADWPAGSLAWGYYPLRIPATAPTGVYSVFVRLQDSSTGQFAGEPFNLHEFMVQTERCDYSARREAIETDAVFGDALRLVEYRLLRKGGRLELFTYWRSEQRMETDYKVFVHVFEPLTGIPAAQHDAMPRYSTSSWWPGLILEHKSVISLEGVPAGEYGVAVGLYEPVSGDRLPLIVGRRNILPDGRLVLDEVISVPASE